MYFHTLLDSIFFLTAIVMIRNCKNKGGFKLIKGIYEAHLPVSNLKLN